MPCPPGCSADPLRWQGIFWIHCKDGQRLNASTPGKKYLKQMEFPIITILMFTRFKEQCQKVLFGNCELFLTPVGADAAKKNAYH